MQLQPAHLVLCRALDWDLRPVDVLRLVRDDPHPVALLGAWAGGGAVIGSAPVLVRSPPQDLGEVLDAPVPVPGGGPGDPVTGPASRPGPAGQGPGAVFGGGWIGCLGYGLAGEVVRIPPAPGGPRRLPIWWFGY